MANTQKTITVALAGNPNSGKTTIFNALTGARQHVGNYAGVTVEKKEGVREYNGYKINFVDLPGTYSLTAYSIEEIVARDFIISQHPDIVIDVVDASNFERNLYLSTQILELKVPLILNLNMSDVAKKQGFKFDDDKISEFFNAPVIHTIGGKPDGINNLLNAIIDTVENPKSNKPLEINYGREFTSHLTEIGDLLDAEHTLVEKYGRKWLALKLLEHDKEILDLGHKATVLDAVEKASSNLEKIYGDTPEILAADRRYGFISGVYEQTVRRSVEYRHNVSDLVDKVMLNRVLGFPIFFGLMYIVFSLVFLLGTPLGDMLENGFILLKQFILNTWPQGNADALRDLVVEGIIGGVGGVLVFLPNILLLFLAIAFLEDTGYMARAAFIMDKIMHKIGLHGKSFIPMLIGFGCTVPAIMGTRILDDKRSRLTTMLVLPLMSCGARLTIYLVIVPAFFPDHMKGFVTWSLYMIGIVLAIAMAKLLRHTLFKGEATTFLMELPPYRIPTLRGMLIHMWERSWMYLKKAGTLILLLSVVLWAATTYPKPSKDELAGMKPLDAQKYELTHSIAGRIGVAMEPIIKPLGFDYRIGTALMGALVAKEVFVSQLSIVFSIEETAQEEVGKNLKPLQQKLQNNYSRLQAVCIMLFCLISAPCVATTAACWRESGSWKWAALQFFGLTFLAYGITFVVYQIGSHFL